MNKKLLFGIMSLAALAACTNDDFETQNGAQVSEQVSPIQFEVINNAEVTRASMDGNTIKWSAKQGDLFTLYHGVTGFTAPSALSGYENATYKASEGEGGAVLTTPSVIKEGRAIMVWPVDTAFNGAASTAGFYKNGANLAVKIPEVLTNIENNIPYASDLLTIQSYAAYSETATAPAIPTAYTTAGKDRKYAVYMRPMASQLILKADYAGTDAVINALATGDDPIDPIALTSVEINDPTNTSLTKAIDLSFTTPAAPQATNWNTVANNVWSEVTGFNRASAQGVAKLTTKCINGIESAKFLMLPQSLIGAAGLTGANIVVNTIYGKVELTAAKYGTEINSAWYRYVAPGTTATYGEAVTTTAGTGSDASKVRYTNDIEKGLAQVIDLFSTNTTQKATSVVVDEPTGAVGTRYVKVLLTKLDMNGLHIKTDKQLYDAVRVWKAIGKTDVTVNLDGDAKKEFEISQKTIAKINEINAELAEETTPRKFNVTACNATGEVCNTIVITGGGAVQNMDFILNTTAAADVALKAGENWKWAASTVKSTKAFKVAKTACGISKIINRGTLVSDATATIAIFDNTTPNPVQVYIPFENNGTWNINAGVLNVQFDVTNNGIVNIEKGAQYRQDGTGNDFTNEAETLPERFFMNDPTKTAAMKAEFVEKIGVVNNKGVFATVNSANIINYGLIEHADKDAKTYITSQQNGAGFASAWGAGNKIGRINLPYSNKDEDNISVSAALNSGFVSVTVSSDDAPTNGILNATVVGTKVNYVIVNGGIKTIAAVSNQVKYVEINQPGTETAWTVAEAGYDGLMILSDVNIKLGTKIAATATYIAADMYVGGTFNKDASVTIGTGTSAKTYGVTKWNTYFGNTTSNVAAKYITY